MYKIVVSCPGDYGKKQSCEKPIDKKTRPEDIVLVSSKDGLVIFWNEDCARCHGITDIIRQEIFLNVESEYFLHMRKVYLPFTPVLENSILDKSRA
jgi:hypothetical protein